MLIPYVYVKNTSICSKNVWKGTQEILKRLLLGNGTGSQGRGTCGGDMAHSALLQSSTTIYCCTLKKKKKID